MNKPTKDYLFVGIQLLLFVLYTVPIIQIQVNVPHWLETLGLAITVMGMILIGWAFLSLSTSLSPFPTPKNNNELKTDGLFKWVRHPIYSGLILFFGGYAMAGGSIHKSTITILLYILFYYKSIYEEQLLINRYDSKYINYIKKTGRFFPKFL